jgi:metal-dependent amidase/aminoacylase/carboxypeptidase family protein
VLKGRLSAWCFAQHVQTAIPSDRWHLSRQFYGHGPTILSSAYMEKLHARTRSGIDAIYVGAQTIVALQGLISRQKSRDSRSAL